jgi:hypothetical protein
MCYSSKSLAEALIIEAVSGWSDVSDVLANAPDAGRDHYRRLARLIVRLNELSVEEAESVLLRVLPLLDRGALIRAEFKKKTRLGS